MRITIILLLLSINAFGQERIRPIIWLGPTDNVKVFGLNISPLVFKLPEKSTINGINIEGIGIPFFQSMMPFDPNDRVDTIILIRSFNVNGLSISPFGLIHPGRLNGLAVTPWMSWIDEVNGLSFNIFITTVKSFNGVMLTGYSNSTVEINGVQIGLHNKSKHVRGVQIGLINKTKKLKGFQIGLWNINSKRKFLFFNWNFRE